MDSLCLYWSYSFNSRVIKDDFNRVSTLIEYQLQLHFKKEPLFELHSVKRVKYFFVLHIRCMQVNKSAGEWTPCVSTGPILLIQE